uniref:Uncharacterized protein n=1 Tax=Micrurus lemniscatus lemniscatus TaxID=129467 RepID=A0A2D4IME3_MICLE
MTTKFIWADKRARIKLSALQDNRSRDRFGLPAWETYYKAAGLTWIKEWANLRNKKTLTLEGHDLQMGWHAFMWNPGNKSQAFFHRHIRDSLIRIWREIKNKHYMKFSGWVSTMEALIHPNTLEIGKMVRYYEVLDPQGELKTNQELRDKGLNIDCWLYFQLKTRYKKD